MSIKAEILINAPIEKVWEAFWTYSKNPQDYLPIFQSVKNIYVDENSGQQELMIGDSLIKWSGVRDHHNKIVRIKHNQGSNFQGETTVQFKVSGHITKMIHNENLTKQNGQKTTLEDLLEIQGLIKNAVEQICAKS